MASNFLHGVSVIELPSLGAPITTVSTSIIGLIGTAPGAAAATSASLAIGLVASNNALTFTAPATGPQGNLVSISFINPLANSASLGVVVTGNAIQVNLATNSSGVVTSTATLITAALAANTAAAALLTATNTSTSSGAGVVAPFTTQFLSGGANAAFPLNTPILVTPNSPLISQAGTTGTIPQALSDIFAIVSTGVIVVNVAPGSDSALSEIAGSSTSFTGAWAFTKAKALTGFGPKILIAPGFSSIQAIASVLDAVATRIKAIDIIEGPNSTDAAAITFSQNFSSDRQYLVDPQITELVGGVSTNVPQSATVAAVIALSDQKNGFWWSPSNQQIPNIIGTARPIDYRLSDQYCSANVLNQSNVATIISKNGFYLWGNLATSGNFLVQRRIKDAVEESISTAMQWAIDRPINATFLQDVAAYVNAYLGTLRSKGAIINGNCWPDPVLNTPSSLASGNVYFDFDFVGPYPAQTITFQVSVNNGYLTQIVSTGSSSLTPTTS